jgi:S-adenosylmethionine:tRNA ribosyltransferase-isomerase
VLDKEDGDIAHDQFKNITNYLDKSDVLVLNDTKVLPAKLIGTKVETNAIIEILLLKEVKDNTWECLIKPLKRVKIDTIINFSDKLTAKVTKILDEG